MTGSPHLFQILWLSLSLWHRHLSFDFLQKEGRGERQRLTTEATRHAFQKSQHNSRPEIVHSGYHSFITFQMRIRCLDKRDEDKRWEGETHRKETIKREMTTKASLENEEREGKPSAQSHKLEGGEEWIEGENSTTERTRHSRMRHAIHSNI